METRQTGWLISAVFVMAIFLFAGLIIWSGIPPDESRILWFVTPLMLIPLLLFYRLHGWGIHYSLNTTIYNISGFDAIELSFRGKRRRVRIGTNEAEKLAAYINSVIAGKRKSG
ncbi:MAG: hypothetical protein FD166_769 [Bacteroidetes bacterium]|nr:MAG: hypothetical protein FD166_769 [Bacteroidota bacterium]